MKNSKVVMEIVIIISLLFALSTVVLADNTQIIIGGGSTNTQNDTATNIPNVVMNTTTNTNVNTNTNTSYRTNTNTETLPKTGVTDGYVVAILVTVCAISAIYAYKKIRDYNILVIPLSWMLFAIPSLKDIGSYIGRLFAFSGGTAVHARDFLVYGRQYAVVLVIGLLVSTPLPEKLWRRIRTSPLGTVLLLVLFWVCVYCMAVATNDPFMYFSF